MPKNEAAVEFNMFGPLMKDWISGNPDSADIVSIEQSRTNKEY